MRQSEAGRRLDVLVESDPAGVNRLGRFASNGRIDT